MKKYEVIGAGVSGLAVVALGLGLVFGMGGSDGETAKTGAPAPAPAAEKPAPAVPAASVVVPAVTVPAAPVTASQAPVLSGTGAAPSTSGAGSSPADAKTFLEQAAPIIEALTGGTGGAGGASSSLTPESLMELLKNPTALPGGLSGLPIPR